MNTHNARHYGKCYSCQDAYAEDLPIGSREWYAYYNPHNRTTGQIKLIPVVHAEQIVLEV